MFKMLIAGNDNRSLKAADFLREAFPDSVIMNLNDIKLIEEAFHIYLLPIPLSSNNGRLNNTEVDISADLFLKAIPKEALIIGVGVNLENAADLNSRDDFAYMNAVPTAEGAIKLCIGAAGKTLDECNVLVTGAGRVSKILLHRLSAFTKNLTVAARKAGDIAFMRSCGYSAVTIDSLAENLGRFDIIFNTVPFKIFNGKTLIHAKKDSVFIELASNLSGFDTGFINVMPVTFINAPALPSKVAPITAGRILADTVINIINEKNIG